MDLMAYESPPGLQVKRLMRVGRACVEALEMVSLLSLRSKTISSRIAGVPNVFGVHD